MVSSNVASKNAGTDQTSDIRKIQSLIHDIRFAMLTSASPEGILHSRPMATQEAEFDGTMWFFTQRSSGKVDEIQNDQHVNVAYAKPESNRWVSIAGAARLVDDKVKARALWKPAYTAFFPKGLDDPELTLLRVDAQSAQYWEGPSNSIVKIAAFIRAAVSGDRSALGESRKVALGSASHA